MFSHNAQIQQIKSVFFGNKPFASGEIIDCSGKRSCHEIVFKYSGNAKIKFDGKEFTETENHIRFMPAGDEYINYTCETVEPGDYCYFSFDGCNLPDRLERLELNGQQALSVGALFMRLYHTWATKQTGYEHLCLSIAYEILARLEKIEYTPSDVKSKLAPAINYIGKHLCESFDCSVLAKLCGLSYSRFKTVFAKAYGMPPVKYITELRMKLACDRLKQSPFPITKIALTLGYDDAAYFSRVFRKTVGCSPKEYRQRQEMN